MLKMATIPQSIYGSKRTVRTMDKPGQARRVRPMIHRRGDMSGWQALMAEAYPVVGLMLIMGYLLWVLCLGESTLPWVGDLPPVE